MQWPQVQEGRHEYKFDVAEKSAHLVARQFAPLIGAPLRCVRTFVLDTDKPAKGLTAAITCQPPANRTRLIGAKQQTRLPNDTKGLTANGASALERHGCPRQRGMLWRQSIVWQLDYRCSGTGLCDMPTTRSYSCDCSLRVQYSASVEQIHKGVVTVVVTVTVVGGAGVLAAAHV